MEIKAVDVVHEERAWQIVEGRKVVDGSMSGIGGIEVSHLVVGIAPGEDVGYGKVGDGGCQCLGPPSFVWKAFVTGFGEGGYLAVFLGKTADVGELPLDVFYVVLEGGGLVVAETVAVEAEDVDHFITGITFHIGFGRFGAVG